MKGKFRIHFPKKSFSTTMTTLDKVRKFNPKIPIEEAFTPPSSWYLDKDFFELECEKVFKNNWVGVCSDHMLYKPGDYITGEIVEQPYVIIKNQKDEIKAFYNVCAHHAARVAIGTCGSCEQLVCPYHGWTYNLDGSLTKSTQMKGIKNFKPKENGLKPINKESIGNILFLNMCNISTNSPESFKDIVSPFIKALEDFDFDPTFSDLKFVKRKEYPLKCNWKVFVDNYCDGGYHISYAHKSLTASLDMNSYKIDIYNKCSIQTTKSAGSKNDSRIGKGAVYAYIYPNIAFNRYGPWLDINVILPISENECVILFEWFLHKDYYSDAKFIEESLKASEVVQDEDIFLCENVMKGIKSDAYDVGRYVPSKETPAYRFHQELYNDLIK